MSAARGVRAVRGRGSRWREGVGSMRGVGAEEAERFFFLDKALRVC